MRWYRLAAEQGDSVAQYNLGVMYTNGQGVLQDYAEAVKWYRLSAEQGDATAQTNLGIMYEYGRGLPQNKIMAHMWYNLASANGAEKAGEWRDERAGLMTTTSFLDRCVFYGLLLSETKSKQAIGKLYLTDLLETYLSAETSVAA